MTDPRLVGEVVIDPDKRLKGRVGEVGGREFVDLRVFVQDDEFQREHHSTKAGFAIPKSRLPVLIQLLRSALEE